ncbi:MAG TPA: hypothetical protein VJ851_04555 [Jatrophihabitans sp.]|nr:hypothetical protein [Jatrophihabitans sp.]
MATPEELQGLTDAFRRCVGWGASPERLGVNRGAFGFLPALSELDDVHAAAAGTVIRAAIDQALGQLSGTYELFGRTYAAGTIRAAIRLELAFDHPDWSAHRRRSQVITLLGTHHMPGYWARPEGPEWELLQLFAEHLVDVQKAKRL